MHGPLISLFTKVVNFVFPLLLAGRCFVKCVFHAIVYIVGEGRNCNVASSKLKAKLNFLSTNNKFPPQNLSFKWNLRILLALCLLICKKCNNKILPSLPSLPGDQCLWLLCHVVRGKLLARVRAVWVGSESWQGRNLDFFVVILGGIPLIIRWHNKVPVHFQQRIARGRMELWKTCRTLKTR